MNEKDREAADDWIRDNMPDPDECSLQDNEEGGDTQSYFFLRYRDSATVAYRVARFVLAGLSSRGQQSRFFSLQTCSGRLDALRGFETGSTLGLCEFRRF